MNSSKPNTSSRQAETSSDRSTAASYEKLPPGFRPKAGRAQRDPIDYDSHINTTMIYLHLTHRSEQDSRALVESLCRDLPR